MGAEKSNMTIWKYPIEIVGEQQVSMPFGAIILSAQMEANSLCLWAFVDPVNETEKRTIEIFGTNYPVTGPGERRFIGTVQQRKSSWHVFEKA